MISIYSYRLYIHKNTQITPARSHPHPPGTPCTFLTSVFQAWPCLEAGRHTRCIHFPRAGSIQRRAGSRMIWGSIILPEGIFCCRVFGALLRVHNPLLLLQGFSYCHVKKEQLLSSFPSSFPGKAKQQPFGSRSCFGFISFHQTSFLVSPTVASFHLTKILKHAYKKLYHIFWWLLENEING